MKYVKMMSVLAFAAIGPGLSSAHALEKAQLDQYVRIQEALAKDSLGEAKKAAADLENAKGKGAKELKKEAGAVAKAKSLEEARESFKKLSVPVTKALLKDPVAGYERYNCSMAKADWVQKAGDTANPYYSKEMASCGEKVK